MSTTFWFYIAFALLIILPLILLNLKKFRKFDKGGKRIGINKVRIAVVSIISVLVAVFAIGLYNTTVNYQPMIIAERYFTEVGKLQSGIIDLDQFRKNTESFAVYHDNYASDIEILLTEIEASENSNAVKFQIGDEITSRYYGEPEEIFMKVEDAGERNSKEAPVYIGIHADVDGSFKNYLLLIRKEGSKSFVENFYEISEESMEYLSQKNFMRGDLVSKWYEAK